MTHEWQDSCGNLKVYEYVMVPVNVYVYAVLSTPQILGFTSGYILIFLRGTPQNLTRLHAYASGSMTRAS